MIIRVLSIKKDISREKKHTTHICSYDIYIILVHILSTAATPPPGPNGMATFSATTASEEDLPGWLALSEWVVQLGGWFLKKGQVGGFG